MCSVQPFVFYSTKFHFFCFRYQPERSLLSFSSPFYLFPGTSHARKKQALRKSQDFSVVIIQISYTAWTTIYSRSSLSQFVPAKGRNGWPPGQKYKVRFFYLFEDIKVHLVHVTDSVRTQILFGDEFY